MEKLRLVLLVLLVSFLSQQSWAGVIGDVDGDGQVSLPEALYALQVASGTASPDLPSTCVITGSGEWVADAVYTICDVVKFTDGTFYIATQEHTASVDNSPPETGNWAVLAFKGDEGASPFVLSGDDATFTAGNVGIGTETPSEKLEVDGDVLINMDLVFSNTNLDIHGPDSGTQIFDFSAGDEYTNYLNDTHIRIWGDKTAGRDNRFLDIYHDGERSYIETSGHPSTFGLDLALQGNGGRVGIGTVSPRTKLEVKGDVLVRPEAGWLDGETASIFFGTNGAGKAQISSTHGGHFQLDSYYKVIFQSANTGIENNDYRGFDFKIFDADVMKIDGTGKVGIGTSSPTEKLEVAGTVKATNFTGNGSSLTNVTAASINWNNITGVPTEFSDGTDDDSPDDDSEVPDSISINNSRLYAPSGSGNVGIGTTSPLQALDIRGNLAFGMDAEREIKVHGWDGKITIGAPDELSFQTYESVDEGFGASVWKNRLTVANDGNVGINTTTPTAQLDVNGNIAVSGTVDGRNLSADGATLDTLVSVGATDTTNDSWTGTGDITMTSGNVGIGTQSPTEKLEVVGTVKADNFIGGDLIGSFGAAGTTTVRTGAGATGGNISLKYDIDNNLASIDTHDNADNTYNPLSVDAESISFRTGPDDDHLNNQLTITTDGKIGIGTSTPAGELHVGKPGGIGDITFTGSGLNDISVNHSGYNGLNSTIYAVRVQNPGPTPNLIEYSSDGGSTWSAPTDMLTSGLDVGDGVTIGFDSTSGHIYGDTWTWTVDKAFPSGFVVKDGKVGINKVDPAEQLHVAGNIAVSGTVDGRDLSADGEQLDNLSNTVTSMNSAIIALSNGQPIGALLNGGSAEYTIITEKDYVFKVDVDNGSVEQFYTTFYESTDCSGQPYTSGPSFPVRTGVQGVVYNAYWDSSNSIAYIPHGSVEVEKVFASMWNVGDNVCALYGPTTMAELYAVFPNNPAVTGVQNTPYATPITLTW